MALSNRSQSASGRCHSLPSSPHARRHHHLPSPAPFPSLSGTPHTPTLLRVTLSSGSLPFRRYLLLPGCRCHLCSFQSLVGGSVTIGGMNPSVIHIRSNPVPNVFEDFYPVNMPSFGCLFRAMVAFGFLCLAWLPPWFLAGLPLVTFLPTYFSSCALVSRHHRGPSPFPAVLPVPSSVTSSTTPPLPAPQVLASAGGSPWWCIFSFPVPGNAVHLTVQDQLTGSLHLCQRAQIIACLYRRLRRLLPGSLLDPAPSKGQSTVPWSLGGSQWLLGIHPEESQVARTPPEWLVQPARQVALRLCQFPSFSAMINGSMAEQGLSSHNQPWMLTLCSVYVLLLRPWFS